MKSQREVLYIEDRGGYELKCERVTHDDGFGGEISLEVIQALTYDGHYIGDERAAERLVKDFGIKPEVIKSTDNICSIGYSTKVGNWFAWTNPRRPKAFDRKQDAVDYIMRLDRFNYKPRKRK